MNAQVRDRIALAMTAAATERQEEQMASDLAIYALAQKLAPKAKNFAEAYALARRTIASRGRPATIYVLRKRRAETEGTRA